jgi:hypothetical protein
MGSSESSRLSTLRCSLKAQISENDGIGASSIVGIKLYVPKLLSPKQVKSAINLNIIPILI